jgi:hypothetical protein
MVRYETNVPAHSNDTTVASLGNTFLQPIGQILVVPIRWRKLMLEKIGELGSDYVPLEDLTLKDNRTVREIFNRYAQQQEWLLAFCPHQYASVDRQLWMLPLP